MASLTSPGAKDPLDWLVQESVPVALNEEGDDDSDEDADGGEEDDGEKTGGGSDDAEGEPKKPFENLELRKAFCFGWCPVSAGKCWANIADESVTRGWKSSDVARLDEDLKRNVDACYFFPCQGTFEDLDTGYRWRAAFVADHAMWKLELDGSPEAEVLPEDAKAFFSCEYFMKFAKRCGDILDRAKKIYWGVVDRHVKAGELMKADTVKLERILHDLGVARYTDNLRNGKYELA